MGLQPKWGANPYRYSFLFPELRTHLAHAAVEARVAPPQMLRSLLELPRALLPELLRTALLPGIRSLSGEGPALHPLLRSLRVRRKRFGSSPLAGRPS
ncbi:hypothetical protein GUJ93_ZPchr0012g19083 [Zizania palustris]|uniref:Uncharacterized protein n=1 Tax=Zizania palustris TaxID=103762 RepID=A0A8J5W4W8_ZIZPA|nr:hypothetical protein GUJ93_ZPchr0007g5992 [Zizania palustris]KAG8084115.1 hypothetical protein GUJ93_ZPchr0010g8756 [Zizania palustris]KAG8092185.1 hypothetical protein GUJ93_ZPchr0012g19083 [Zizania palustris]